MTHGLSPRLAELLTFIGTFIQENGHSPSYLEIQKALDLRSKSNVHYMLDRLRSRGHIDYVHGKSRSIWITSPKSEKPKVEIFVNQRRELLDVKASGGATVEVKRRIA